MKCLQRAVLVCCCILVVAFVLVLRQAHYEVELLTTSDTLGSLRRVIGLHGGDGLPKSIDQQTDVLVGKAIGKSEIRRENLQTNKIEVANRMSMLSPWEEYKTWVSSGQLYSQDSLTDGSMRRVLHAMSTRNITRALVGHRGTQLKATLTLKADQKVVFKPMRYNRDAVITGNPYSGYDRHNAEIAAFHLDGILGFRRAPPVAGRRVSLTKEVLAVAHEKLSKTFFKEKDTNNVCFYGVCYYCKRSDPACAKGDTMEGSVTLWLPSDLKLKTWRHPWIRTYIKGRQARWEVDDNYCERVTTAPPYNKGRRFLDIMDTAVFDYLIGNGDRHHYESFDKDGNDGMLLLLDNAKSFGNPSHDEHSILAPIYQCCRIRRLTWRNLLSLARAKKSLGSRLREATSIDLVAPVLDPSHFDAVDRRLNKVINMIRTCISKQGEENVLKEDDDF